MTANDALTLDAIRAAADIVRGHTLPPAYLQDGRRAYLVAVGRKQFDDLLKMEARDNWYDYYRAVRTLRRIRIDDAKRFKQFSQAWWRSRMRQETEAEFPNDGRFGRETMPLKDRLRWHKLGALPLKHRPNRRLP